jgi:hypothetical protein
MVVSQSLSTCARTLLAGFQNDHLARDVFNLTLAVVREHALLQSIRYGLDVLAPFVLDYPKRAKPNLGVKSDEVG